MTNTHRNLDDILDQAVAAFRSLQSKTADERRAWLKTLKSLPPSIPLGDGNHVLTTQSGIDALHEFGKRWRAEDPARRDAIDQDEAAKLAVHVFGRILAGVDIAHYPDDTSLKKVLKDQLEKRLSTVAIATTHYIPCQIFEEASFKRFAVGPVEFLDRMAWLNEVERHAGRALPWLPAVRDHWEGRAKAPPAPDGTNSGFDAWTAHAVVEAVGSCGWIACIEIEHRERDRSRECAQVAVRVALETLLLALHPNTARDVRGPGEELRATLSKPIHQMAGRNISISSRLEMPRLKSSATEADQLLAATADLRRVGGDAIASFIDLHQPNQNDSVDRRWIEAMYWYGTARRDPIEFIGLVHSGMALDVLSKGGRTNGIVRMCCGLFGVPDTEIVTSDGQTLRKLVITIYEEGRSQIGHGGRLTLLQDLPIARETALQFAAVVLKAYIERFAKYSGKNDIKEFLASVGSPCPTAAAIHR